MDDAEEVEEIEEDAVDEEEIEEEGVEEPTKKQLTECPVCCEPFNNSTRKAITCFACPSVACSQCLRRFILGLPGEAQCMGCKTKWDRGFMLTNFTLKFVKGEYKEHLEVYFLDREKALLPETQARIARELKVVQLREERRKIVDQLNAMDIKIRDMANGQPTDAEKKQFTRACPADTCRGFLSTAWICGLCSTHVCSKCHEIKDSKTVAKGGKPHTCLKENVETATLLAKDTKPCPKCASLIFKIDGCDQMWCVQCKTGFSWKSGRIEMVVHNPHYYEWLRQQKGKGSARRNPGDVPCGGLIDAEELDALIRNDSFPLPKELYWYIFLVHRDVQHHRNVTIRTHMVVFEPRNNEDLRYQYLKGYTDLERMAKLIQQREVKRERQVALNDVVGMFTTAAEDLFRNLDHEMMTCITEIEPFMSNKKRRKLCSTLQPKYVEVARKFKTEMTALYDYTVEHLAAIGKQYRFKASVVYPVTDKSIAAHIENEKKRAAIKAKAKALEEYSSSDEYRSD